MNVEVFFETFVKIIERREGVKITYRLVKREDLGKNKGGETI